MTDAPTLRLGLIGDNIRASRSPLLHRLAGEMLGRPTGYDSLIPAEFGRDFTPSSLIAPRITSASTRPTPTRWSRRAR